MKFNRDFLFGALVALALSVPLTAGLAVARAQGSHSAGMQPGATSAEMAAQMQDHWQTMLEQQRRLAEAETGTEARLTGLIGAVETADSSQQELEATAKLAVALAREDIDNQRSGMYGVGGMLSQMAMMGRIQGWMSDEMYQDSMLMMGGSGMHHDGTGALQSASETHRDSAGMNHGEGMPGS